MSPVTDVASDLVTPPPRVSRRLAARRQLDRRALLDPQHPRLVRVRAVEARDLDVDGAVRVLGDDERHLFVGESAVVGDAEHAQAFRGFDRNVAEHLRDDRLRALVQVWRDVRRLQHGRRGLRVAQRLGHRPEHDEIVVDLEMAETHGHQRAGFSPFREVEPEEVLVVAVRGVAEVQGVGLHQRAYPRTRSSIVPRLEDPGARGGRGLDRGQCAGSDLGRCNLGLERQAGLDVERQRLEGVRRDAGQVPVQLAVRRERRVLKRSLQGRQEARAGDVARLVRDLHRDLCREEARAGAREGEADVVGDLSSIVGEVLDRELRQRQRLPVVGGLREDRSQQILEGDVRRQPVEHEVLEQDRRVAGVAGRVGRAPDLAVVPDVSDRGVRLDSVGRGRLAERRRVRARERARAVEDLVLRRRRDPGERDACERRAREVDPGERDACERRPLEIDPGERDACQRRAAQVDPGQRDARERDPGERHTLEGDADHRLVGERVRAGAGVPRLRVDVVAPGGEILGGRRAADAGERDPGERQAAEGDAGKRNAGQRAGGDVDVIERSPASDVVTTEVPRTSPSVTL